LAFLKKAQFVAVASISLDIIGNNIRHFLTQEDVRAVTDMLLEYNFDYKKARKNCFVKA